MVDFNTLGSLYEHVEKTCSLTVLKTYELIDLFQKFRDAKHEENNTEAADKAQWEIHFLSFYLVEGDIRPNVERGYENGKVVAYPTLDLFDEEVYEYLKTRLEATTHPKLKAHYAQILWCSPDTKHQNFAKIAIDAYLEYLTSYEQNCATDDYFSQEICEVVKNAYAIALRSRHKINHLKSELLRFIQLFSSGDVFSVSTLIGFMLNTRKGFAKEDFEGLENICWQIAESISNDAHSAINFLKIGKRVDQRLEKQTYKWVLRIAQHNESQMTFFEKDAIAALHFCMQAIENYKQVGDSEKIKALEKRYTELKESLEFHTIEREVDIKPILMGARELIEKHTTEEIICILSGDETLLPTLEEVRESVKASIKKSPTAHLLPKEISDRQDNVVQHFVTDDEKMDYSILRCYKLQLETLNIYLINAILLETVSTKKLTIHILLDYLIKQCWYGKIPNWINLIAPSLNEYFKQMYFHLAYPSHNEPNFVLCLDSLTLKIEGLFRDLCHVSGVPTTYHRQDHAGRNIAREKDIDVLLREETIQDLFDENDLFFFKFILVEKCGYNLRHDIAHSLLPFDGYHFANMNLMILALLRLGKYDFAQMPVEKETNVECVTADDNKR